MGWWGCVIYSESVISANIERVERLERKRRAALGLPRADTFRLVRFPTAIIEEMVEHIGKLIDSKSGKYTRELTEHEQAFIDNELMVCQLDFRYACENYLEIQLASQSDRPAGWDDADNDEQQAAGARIGKFVLNGMQIQMLKKLARLEEACYEALARGAPVNGILLIVHKARQLGACLRKGTLVLTADLRWIPIETVQPGECLVSCDEKIPRGKGFGRKMRLAVVEATRELEADTLRVVMSDGRLFEATPEHRFLCKVRGGQGYQWRHVSDMRVGDEIRHVVHPWGEPSYEDGWFSGLLDGEGSLRGRSDAGGSEVCVSQVPGAVLDRATKYLRDNNFWFRVEEDNRKSGDSSKLGNQPVHKLVFNRISSIFRLLGKTQPSRFRARIDWWEGKELPNGDFHGGHLAKIVAIEPAGVQKVYDLQTSTGTFIAEGLVSHNSLMWQALLLHRVNFYSHINALTASIDDKNTQALFRRFERMYERMPVWMRARIKRQNRETGIQFERDSVVELQSGRQDKDLGKGETWHAVHITEAASFDNLSRHLDEGLLPTVPFSIYTLYGVESTSDGKSGDWYDFVTAVMSGTAEGGAGRFSHYFAPFYLIDMEESSKGQRSKYRIEAPIDWQPSVATRMMAMRVKSSSHEYCGTDNLELHRDVLYWYESTRAYYHKRGKLNLFLQSFPIDAEESFQHSSAGAFPNDTIARLKDSAAAYDPWPYRIATADELSDIQPLVTERKRLYPVGQHYLAPMPAAELEHERDMRGVIFLFEQPDDRYTYSLGADPTGGIPGWRREFRQHNDINTDNGAIEIFRKGKPPVTCETCAGRCWMPTSTKGVTVECRTCYGRGKIGGRAVQVAEFAAPIDAEELALYVYVLGRLFRGNSEFDECLAVIENNNTGILTIRKLQTVYQYTNLYQSDTSMAPVSTPKYTNSIGFFSGPMTVPLLHARSRSIVMRRDADVRSPHLIKEYSDAVVKITGTSNDSGSDEANARMKAIVVRERFVVKPGGGRHDDRMIASFLSFLGLFDMMEVGSGDDADEQAARRTVPDLAARDATAEEQQRQWNDLTAEYTDGLLMLGEHYPDCSLTCTEAHGTDDEETEFWESGEGELEYEYEERY